MTGPCPTCGVDKRTLVVELGTYKRKSSWGWRVKVTDPNGDSETEAKAAGHILVILYEVFRSLVKEAGQPVAALPSDTERQP